MLFELNVGCKLDSKCGHITFPSELQTDYPSPGNPSQKYIFSDYFPIVGSFSMPFIVEYKISE